jgi:hypothetical protein
LDADRVILKAKREKKKERKGKAERSGEAVNGRGPVSEKGRGRATEGARRGLSKAQKNRMRESLDTLMARIDAGEGRVAEIDELFCQPGYYVQTLPDDVRALEDERARLKGEVADLTSQWERTEEELSAQR